MGARFTSDGWTGAKGVLSFALSLLLILSIALAQRAGSLDGINVGAMELAGVARDRNGAQQLTALMLAASFIGDTAARLGLMIVAGIALWAKGRPRAAAWLALVVIAGMLLNAGLKQVFAAPRPDLLPHLDIVRSYSFPSGHAAGNMVLFGALALLAKRRWATAAAIVIILSVGISRIWLGVHWPGDVLAGWIVGLGWLALCAVWLPAGGGEQQRSLGAVERGHAVRRDEAVDPEAVE